MRRTHRIALFTLVIAGLIGGSVAWASLSKTVTVSVDGEQREVSTLAATVEGVLESADLEVHEHDVVVPSLGTEVRDGANIALQRGRPLNLTVDGLTQEAYTTARTVDEALDQLGYRQAELRISASRSERVPLEGMELTINTPREIVLTVDGQTQTVVTTAADVDEFLEEQDLGVGPDDWTSLLRSQPLANFMRLQIIRVAVSEVTVAEPVPFPVTETPDDTLFEGEREVDTPGVLGEVSVIYRVTSHDGVEVSREVLSSTPVREPVTEVARVGTKPRSGPAGGGNAPSADGLNWAALAQCESGGNPRAVSSSGRYRGLYQFSLQTWGSVGGVGDPIDNSPDEQTYRAQILYERSGAGQWPSCGPRLFT